jgi:four helix bundle protein
MASELGHAMSFRDLAVYKRIRAVGRSIFQLTRSFPREETYSLTDQIRRASRSTGAHIAEAWGKRRYEKHFVSKLSDADSENYEVQHWVDTALECGYVTPDQAQALDVELRTIGRMLNSMIEKARLFCRPDASQVREDPIAYDTDCDPDP